MSGIISYGTYIPKRRVRVSEIAEFWGKNGAEIEKNLGIVEKTTPAIDEDSLTLASEAALRALAGVDIKNSELAIAFGSESHPYSVKPTATILANILGIQGNYLAIDTEFACKAATSALIYTLALVNDKKIDYGLVIGSDTAQAKPNDALEYTAACGAVALVLGKEAAIATIVDWSSYSSDTLDFWRRDGQKFPSHAGRFTGEPAYFEHVVQASKSLLKKLKLKPEYFDYAVFHMPNAKFPKEVARRLGFTTNQLSAGFVVENIGNPYSASSLLGLCSVLDKAVPKQKIFLCSYGSGAGSDAFVVETTDKLTAFQKKQRLSVESQINTKYYVSYSDVLKIMSAKGYLKYKL